MNLRSIIQYNKLYNYCRLRGQVKNYILENKKEECLDKIHPIYPFHIKILFKHQKGARDMYQVFNTFESEDNKLRTKWH